MSTVSTAGEATPAASDATLAPTDWPPSRDTLEEILSYWFARVPQWADLSVELDMDQYRQVMGAIPDPAAKDIYAARSLKYKPLIEEILRLGLTGADVAKEARDGRSALALLILLDQHPRTIWRKDDAHVVYAQTDPIVLQLVKEHIMPRKLYEDSAIGGKANPIAIGHIALGFMHHEDVEDNRTSLQMFKDAVEWAAPTRQAFKGGIDFAQAHLDVLVQFGRCKCTVEQAKLTPADPYRNDCLKRAWTDEEKAWQAEGGAFWMK